MQHVNWRPGLGLSLTLYIAVAPAASVAHADFDFSLYPAHPSAPQAANGGASFQTDEFTGSFAYSIPIVVPPGRPGATPSLALSYSSGGGNGWTGVGWMLNVGYVERDGRYGVPIKWTTTAEPAPLTLATLPDANGMLKRDPAAV
jgi:hypothetical protein